MFLASRLCPREEGKDNGYKGNNVGQDLVPRTGFLKFPLEK